MITVPGCRQLTPRLVGQSRLSRRLLPLPQGILVELAEAWQRGAEELTERDSDIAEYVESLENERDTSDLPEASGDAIAKEFERYLRRRTDDD